VTGDSQGTQNRTLQSAFSPFLPAQERTMLGRMAPCRSPRVGLRTWNGASVVLLVLSSFAATHAQAVILDRVGESQNQAYGMSVGGGADFDADGVHDVAVLGFCISGCTPFVDILSGRDGSRIHRETLSPGSFPGQALAALPDATGDRRPELLVKTGVPPNIVWRVYDGAIWAVVRSFTGFWEADHAGDVDGDGLSDVVLGDAGHAGGAGRYEVRAVVSGSLLFSGAGSSSTSNPWGLGTSVASAGDVNGDGFDDVIIGAPFADSQGTNGDGAGIVIVRFGPTGLNGFFIHGAGLNSRHGDIVSGVGDIDGDGFDDVATVATGFSGTFSSGASPIVGRVVIARGPLGIIQAPVLTGSTSRILTGYVGPAGDVTGDGLADVLASVRLQQPGLSQTRVEVLRGPTLSLMTAIPVSGLQYNKHHAPAGRITGNAGGEIVIGDYEHDVGSAIEVGRVRVFAFPTSSQALLVGSGPALLGHPFRSVGNPDRVVEGGFPGSGLPHHCRGRDLVARVAHCCRPAPPQRRGLPVSGPGATRE
jgi:hypothetical protein